MRNVLMKYKIEKETEKKKEKERIEKKVKKRRRKSLTVKWRSEWNKKKLLEEEKERLNKDLKIADILIFETNSRLKRSNSCPAKKCGRQMCSRVL